MIVVSVHGWNKEILCDITFIFYTLTCIMQILLYVVFVNKGITVSLIGLKIKSSEIRGIRLTSWSREKHWNLLNPFVLI